MCLIDAAVESAAAVESGAMIPETQVPAGTHVQKQKQRQAGASWCSDVCVVMCYVLD